MTYDNPTKEEQKLRGDEWVCCPECEGEGVKHHCATDPATGKIHYWETECSECFGEKKWPI